VSINKDVQHPNKVETILGIFVDGGIVCSTNADKFEDILQYLDNIFKITRDDMSYYIGLDVYIYIMDYYVAIFCALNEMVILTNDALQKITKKLDKMKIFLGDNISHFKTIMCTHRSSLTY
jgi:hypothetical protein